MPLQKFLRPLLGCGLLLFAPAARAAIGNPVVIASDGNGIPSGTTVSTKVDAPAGSLIVLFVEGDNDNGTKNSLISACRDSAGNTYAEATQPAGSDAYFTAAIFYSSNTGADLPANGMISCTTTGTAYDLVAVKISGANGGLDTHVPGSSSKDVTSAAIASGTLAEASEIILAVVNLSGGSGGFTQSPKFASTEAGLKSGYAIVNAKSSMTYAPEWVTGRAFAGAEASFKATPAAAR